MRIHLVRNNLESVNVSMRNYADSLARHLGAIQEEISLFHVMPTSPLANLLPRKFKNYFERYFIYPNLIKKIHTDVFHIVDHTFAYLLKHLKGRKVVVTCHDLILLKLINGEFPGYRAPPFAAYLFKNSIDYLEQASKIIAGSENTRNDLAKLLGIPPEKVTVVHYGIDHALFKRQSTENDLNIKEHPNDRVILHVGGDWFYKNTEAIIKAMGLLGSDLKKSVKFLKVGSRFNKNQIKLAKESGIASNLKEIPYAQQNNLPSLYNASDVLCFPSLYEGFGWPPLEAMACGTPVITSKRASLPEVCADAAIYVEPQDYRGIASAIESVLLNTGVRNNLIEKGLQRAKMFHWKSCARKTYELYKELAQA